MEKHIPIVKVIIEGRNDWNKEVELYFEKEQISEEYRYAIIEKAKGSNSTLEDLVELYFKDKFLEMFLELEDEDTGHADTIEIIPYNSAKNELNSIEELALLLKVLGERLRPIEHEEFMKIQNFVNKPLPKVYKEFMLTMGRSAGSYMLGSDIFYDKVFDLNNWGRELLEENGFKELPVDAFVFWMHQGYQMAFFILGESDNPIVYYYDEGSEMNDFRKDTSLLEFLEIQLAMSFPELK